MIVSMAPIAWSVDRGFLIIENLPQNILVIEIDQWRPTAIERW